MSNVILPLLATVALSAITGITGMHYHQVNKMVENGHVTASAVATSAQIDQVTPQNSRLEYPARASVTELPVAVDRIPEVPVITSESSREEAYLKLLSQQTQMLSRMRDEQKNLHSQLSEANRDIDELTFRVDSHSSAFRPLRVNNVRPRGLNTVQDNNIDVDGNDTGVLPPKR